MATPLRRQKPNSHRADGARDRIVAAALKALVEGDGEFEIGDVARRAKVSVGLAYHYFGSKAGLIAVLITDFHNRHEAVVNQSFDKSLPWPVREKARLKVGARITITPGAMGTYNLKAADASHTYKVELKS